MLFLNFFADAQPKYVDLEGIIYLLSIILLSEYLLYSASRRPNSRGVCLLPLQDDLLLVANKVTLQGDLMENVESGSLDLPGQVGRGKSWMRISGL